MIGEAATTAEVIGDVVFGLGLLAFFAFFLWMVAR